MRKRPDTSGTFLILTAVALVMACGGAEADSQVAAGAQVANPPGTDVSARTPKPGDGTAWIVNGSDTVQAEVARSDAERAAGLMYRDSVPDGTGMIFIFPDEAPRGFWMQNTPAALDIAYINAQLLIVDIQQMEPLTEDIHNSAAPAMFALEVRKGWFAENGWKAGDRLTMVFPDR
jgi:hypothetical protein